MRKALALGVAAFVLAACGPIRETHTKIVVVDGHKFLCSYTENNVSHNRSEQQCTSVNG